MKPLIKWPGGKSSELKWIISNIPSSFNPQRHMYVEPFFGGGALFFNLLPKKSLINDLDKDLINFYTAVKTQNPEFMFNLDKILKDWNYTKQISTRYFDSYLTILKSNNIEDPNDLSSLLEQGKVLAEKFDYSKFMITKDPSQILILKELMIESIVRKWKLTGKIEKLHSTDFDNKNHLDYFETAIKSAYYTYIRELYNQAILSKSYTMERTAHFFFIREFCFGSMFRFNSRQLYNIPYGGINYNTKNFARKITNLRSTKLIKLLSNSVLSNQDFYTFLKNRLDVLDEKSFVFLDPPYDSEFSDYSKNTFQKKDHLRLEEIISLLQEKGINFLLIIKETEFIKKLYPPSKFQVSSFDKNYTYNMRGRNKRSTSHLLITNKN